MRKQNVSAATLWPAITERDCAPVAGIDEVCPTCGRIRPMSPVSRGRKKKRPTTRPRNARVVPGLAGVHAELLGAFRPVLQATDPLEVEVLTSDLLGSWWKRLPPGEDPDAVFGEGAIGYAAQAGTREAMALLRALAVLGVTPAQRDTASARRRRWRRPAWPTRHGRPRSAGCGSPPVGGWRTCSAIRPACCRCSATDAASTAWWRWWTSTISVVGSRTCS